MSEDGVADLFKDYGLTGTFLYADARVCVWRLEGGCYFLDYSIGESDGVNCGK
jgi:hypothetical protein